MNITKQGLKLLHGKQAESLWGDIGLISGEYDGITHARLIEFMEVYPCKGITISHNNYGQFQFINLQVNRYMNNGESYVDLFQLWGNGYHESRGVMMVNYQINMGNSFLIKDCTTIDKRLAIAQVNDYRLSQGITNKTKQTQGTNKFSFISELSDDDFASTFMMDHELE